MMSNFASNPIVPFVLAGILQLFLPVEGDSCGALTIAEADDDYMSLRRKAFSNFRSTCRKAVPKQGEFTLIYILNKLKSRQTK